MCSFEAAACRQDERGRERRERGEGPAAAPPSPTKEEKAKTEEKEQKVRQQQQQQQQQMTPLEHRREAKDCIGTRRGHSQDMPEMKSTYTRWLTVEIMGRAC